MSKERGEEGGVSIAVGIGGGKISRREDGEGGLEGDASPSPGTGELGGKMRTPDSPTPANTSDALSVDTNADTEVRCPRAP